MSKRSRFAGSITYIRHRCAQTFSHGVRMPISSLQCIIIKHHNPCREGAHSSSVKDRYYLVSHTADFERMPLPTVTKDGRVIVSRNCELSINLFNYRLNILNTAIHWTNYVCTYLSNRLACVAFCTCWLQSISSLYQVFGHVSNQYASRT